MRLFDGKSLCPFEGSSATIESRADDRLRTTFLPVQLQVRLAVVRQNLTPRAILTAEDDPRHGKGFARSVSVAPLGIILLRDCHEQPTSLVRPLAIA
jgi:hypothetical protein